MHFSRPLCSTLGNMMRIHRKIGLVAERPEALNRHRPGHLGITTRGVFHMCFIPEIPVYSCIPPPGCPCWNMPYLFPKPRFCATLAKMAARPDRIMAGQGTHATSDVCHGWGNLQLLVE
jgi:hypothetical protein